MDTLNSGRRNAEPEGVSGRKENLVLVGFMGTGKTSVARRVARECGLRFVDTDSEVERRTGKSISTIFKQEGETAFRTVENQVIADASNGRGLVIATGGGAVVNPANVESLRRNGFIVCLTASPEVIWRRLYGDNQRPLLDVQEPLEKIKELFAQREPYYSCAEVTIDTSTQDIESVSRQVCDLWKSLQMKNDLLQVDLGRQSYPIFIGRHLLDRVGELLNDIKFNRQVMVITNNTVQSLYGERVEENLKAAGFRVSVVTLPDGEEHKTLTTTYQLYDKALDAGLTRDSLIVALGGGVIGDTAGFVAATYMRGVPFVQIPTTLLAQVDSSVGGKVAVNHPRGKNLVGSFYQPEMVIADLETLQTLDRRELASGLAEIIKAGIIKDSELFAYLEQHLGDIFAYQYENLLHVVRRACEIKTEVVQADERDMDTRAILNYGHTIGHAVEAATQYKVYRHGEAVAIGMVSAAMIAAELNLCPEELLGRQVNLLRAAGLPVSQGKLSIEGIVTALALDKKVRDGKSRFILPRQLGEVYVTDEVPLDVIRRVLKKQSTLA
ncbi:MAG: 3-dehydroquinate synthase [Syntrophothermus sp.]